MQTKYEQALIKANFQPKGCRVFSESVKLEAQKNVYYPYPDLILTCHPEDLKEHYLVKNPSLLVEVLSKTTADYDRTFKWQRYRKIPSLQHYLLVSQYDFFLRPMPLSFTALSLCHIPKCCTFYLPVSKVSSE
jgi:Uma2 family endonuclease